MKFPSIENAFQAAKYLTLKTGNPDEHLIELQNCNAKMAKSMGTKKYFRQNGFRLDVDKWNDIHIHVMSNLVQQRYRGDPIFAEIIKNNRGCWRYHPDQNNNYVKILSRM